MTDKNVKISSSQFPFDGNAFITGLLLKEILSLLGGPWSSIETCETKKKKMCYMPEGKERVPHHKRHELHSPYTQ